MKMKKTSMKKTSNKKTSMKKKCGGTIEDDQSTMSTILRSQRPFTDDQINTMTRIVTNNPVVFNYVSPGTDNTLLFNYLIDSEIYTVHRNIVPFILLALDVIPTRERFNNGEFKVNPFNYMDWWVNHYDSELTIDEYCSVLKKILKVVDDFGVLNYEKLQETVKIFNFRRIFTIRQETLSQQKENYKKIATVIFSSDISELSSSDLKDSRFTKKLLTIFGREDGRAFINNLNIKHDDDDDNINKNLAYERIGQSKPLFSENAEFYDEEMMPIEGMAKGEFFYNVRDVDKDGKITRAFSKLNFKKLDKNPFTRRDWITNENKILTNSRKKFSLD